MILEMGQVRKYLDDDWDWQIYIVGVDQADSAASEACKSPMHCPLP